MTTTLSVGNMTLQGRIQGGVQSVRTPALLFRCPFSAMLTTAMLMVELLISCLSFIFENIKCRENVRPPARGEDKGGLGGGLSPLPTIEISPPPKHDGPPPHIRCLRGPYGKGLVGHCTSGHSLNLPLSVID